MKAIRITTLKEDRPTTTIMRETDLSEPLEIAATSLREKAKIEGVNQIVEIFDTNKENASEIAIEAMARAERTMGQEDYETLVLYDWLVSALFRTRPGVLISTKGPVPISDERVIESLKNIRSHGAYANQKILILLKSGKKILEIDPRNFKISDIKSALA